MEIEKEFNQKIYRNISYDDNDNNFAQRLEEDVNKYNNDNNDSKYDSFNEYFYISYCESKCDDFYHHNTKNDYDLEEILNENNNLKDFAPKDLFSGSIKDDSTGPNTEEEKYLNKKRDNKNKDEQFKSMDIDNINSNQNIDEKKQEEINRETKTKAKTKTENTQNAEKKNDNKDAKHTKLSEDNIMRKIKTRLVDDSLQSLNNSIKNNSGKFLKLTPKINVNLKRDTELKFLDRTIEDIYANTELNKRKMNNKDHNKKLIEKIFKEKIETETIEILNMKFRVFLKEIREKHIEDFLNKIKTKEIKNEKKKENESEIYIEENIGEDSDNEAYMHEVRRLIFIYENCFTDKKGRKKKKN